MDSRAAEGGRPKAFFAKQKGLQGRAGLRAAAQPDPQARRAEGAAPKPLLYSHIIYLA